MINHTKNFMDGFIKTNDEIKGIMEINNVIKDYCYDYSCQYNSYYNKKNKYWLFEVEQQNGNGKIFINLNNQSLQVEIFYHCYIIIIKLTNPHLKEIIYAYLNDDDIWNTSWDDVIED